MSNLAEGMLPGHWAVLMLLPFAMLGFGLWFIGRAFSDKVDAPPPDPRIVPLPDRKDRPLYHVHMQIRASARRPVSRTDEPDEPDERGSSGRPRRSTGSGPKLVVHR
jgi:hypothetical protein